TPESWGRSPAHPTSDTLIRIARTLYFLMGRPLLCEQRRACIVPDLSRVNFEEVCRSVGWEYGGHCIPLRYVQSRGGIRLRTWPTLRGRISFGICFKVFGLRRQTQSLRDEPDFVFCCKLTKCSQSPSACSDCQDLSRHYF